MTKVVVANLKSTRRRKTGSVTEKRVHDASGKLQLVRLLDANSATFGQDLQYVFERNVAKARRENKRVIGTPDVVLKR